ncbi:MAG: ATP synthase F1 subunit delta [Symbiobacteriia bacterium]
MIAGSIARRYALALFELGQAKGEVERLRRELDEFHDLVVTTPALTSLLANETMPSRQKKQALQAVLGQDQSLYLRNFLLILVDKHREMALADIVRRFHELADEAEGVIQVEMRSAVQLSDAAAENIRASLAKNLGRTVRLTSRVQKELIGGVVLRIGDQLLDGSLKGRLLRLRKQMVQA